MYLCVNTSVVRAKYLSSEVDECAAPSREAWTSLELCVTVRKTSLFLPLLRCCCVCVLHNILYQMVSPRDVPLQTSRECVGPVVYEVMETKPT